MGVLLKDPFKTVLKIGDYSGQFMSMQWLLMPWLLASMGALLKDPFETVLKIGLFRTINVNTMVADVLAPCVARSSAIMVLTTQGMQVLFFQVRGRIFTHWGHDKMATILQTTFSNIFSLMKMRDFQLKFHWRLLLRVQIFQHWLT